MTVEIKYNWQRFWVKRTSSVDLSDGGFLVDPTASLYAAVPDPPRTLADLSGFPVLVLLGEPGIGKSTALRAEAEKLSHADEVISISVDLRAFSSESLLYQQLFGSREYQRWLGDNSMLVLQLDSLDEALLRIDTISQLLASELQKAPVHRLALRIACRTAMWPGQSFEPTLIELWGEANVGIFELAPLRRRDVVMASEANSINAQSFIQELYAAEAVSFAIKPLTLKLLVLLFARDGRLPRSGYELFKLGCLKLSEESSPSRRDARRVGSLRLEQRMRVAGRIAAVTMFASRYAVWTGLQSDIIPPEDVAISSLAGTQEKGDFPDFDVGESQLLEVLDTGLFSSRGVSRMGWSHQSYAEFLAAQYLIDKRIAASEILKLLLHPSGGVVPQLYVVAAWIASLSREVRSALMKSEPLVLLRSDLTNWDERDRSTLVESLLEAFNEQRSYDRIIGLSSLYSKLNHPRLAEQLRPYLIDFSKNEVSRRAALMIAESCRVIDLKNDLLDLALNRKEEPHLRGRALAALRTCGDSSSIPALLELVEGLGNDDPQDDIRGSVLRILWPTHISSGRLFSLIRPPASGYVGAYVMFIVYELPESLSAEDMAPAINWAASTLGISHSDRDFQTQSLADSIFFDHGSILIVPKFLDTSLTISSQRPLREVNCFEERIYASEKLF